MQCEAYRQENARLLGMLAKTKEFSNFAEVAIASGESGVRYMHSESAPVSVKEEPANPLEDGAEEADNWIPEAAFRVAHDFRNKCAANVSKSMMNTMLEDLNKIWRIREKKQIARIKGDANREVQVLRRAVQFRKPYDAVQKDQEIKRLKTDLKDAQQALRENVTTIKSERDGPNQGLQLVDSTVKYTNKILIEKRELVKENEILKGKIEALESMRINGD